MPDAVNCSQCGERVPFYRAVPEGLQCPECGFWQESKRPIPCDGCGAAVTTFREVGALMWEAFCERCGAWRTLRCQCAGCRGMAMRPDWPLCDFCDDARGHDHCRSCGAAVYVMDKSPTRRCEKCV